jgi:hypothetical protein
MEASAEIRRRKIEYNSKQGKGRGGNGEVRGEELLLHIEPWWGELLLELLFILICRLQKFL